MYHFIFVPLTIGLSILVACMQTAWLVKKDPVYLRMTKCFGTLFLNFAISVVTGIVEEFQFGMNWSAHLDPEKPGSARAGRRDRRPIPSAAG